MHRRNTNESQAKGDPTGVQKKVVFESAESLAANPAADITNLVRKSVKRTGEAGNQIGESGDTKKVKFDDELENTKATN